MTTDKFSAGQSGPLTAIPVGPTRSILALEERLSSVEQELRVQFTRMAHLQAEVDILTAGSLRRPRQ